MKKINFWKNKKVLVTGHTGFKGGWLSLWLYILGAKIAGYALNPKTKKNFFNILNLKKIFTIDVRKNIQSISEIKKLIKKFKPEIIFHLAAQPQVLESYLNPLDTIKTNVIGTANILEISKKFNFIKAIVIITTDKVYRNFNKKIRFAEEFPLGGEDIYSSSKASADLISQSYIKSFFKKKHCNIGIARAGNCIGGGDWTKFRILTDSSNSFLSNKKLYLRNPKSIRPWQHVFEPLNGYMLLAEKLYKKKGKLFTESWNFGPREKKHITVKQFAENYRKALSSSSKIEVKKSKEKKEKTYLDLDSQKAMKRLKWKPLLNIEKTIKLTADWYLAYKKKKNLMSFSINQLKEFMLIKSKKNNDL